MVLKTIKVDGEPKEVTNIRNKILKEFNDLTFVEEGHKYFLNGEQLPSVSEVTHQFCAYPFVDPYNGHQYVDLGLPSGTKWATMNVGSTGITDYGNYYQFGKGSNTYQTTSGQTNYTGYETPLASSADTATQVMGGQWHMPTTSQIDELTANTTYTWETDFNGSGINGGKFTASNGNYVFFPAAGYYYNGSINGNGSYGNYWSSISYERKTSSFYLLLVNGSRMKDISQMSGGYSVRGVVG